MARSFELCSAERCDPENHASQFSSGIGTREVGLGQWQEPESADEPYEMWLDALHAGVRALEGYAPDERIGPRAEGEDEDLPPIGNPRGDETGEN